MKGGLCKKGLSPRKLQYARKVYSCGNLAVNHPFQNIGICKMDSSQRDDQRSFLCCFSNLRTQVSV